MFTPDMTEVSSEHEPSQYINLLCSKAAHLLNSNSSFSKMRMGPVELRMMRG